MNTRVVDSKGRVMLGAQFANQTVIIEEVDPTEVRVIMAKVIPQREAWLYENKAAHESVLKGLMESQANNVSSSPPNLSADANWAEQLQE